MKGNGYGNKFKIEEWKRKIKDRWNKIKNNMRIATGVNKSEVGIELYGGVKGCSTQPNLYPKWNEK